MRVSSLRWMARASVMCSCLVVAYLGVGAVVEILANTGVGLAAHDSWLWAAFHPGLAVYIIGLILMAIAAVVSWLARRALRRRTSRTGTLGATVPDGTSA